MGTIGAAFQERSKDKDNNFLLLRLIAALLVVYGHANALSKPIPGFRDIFSQIDYQYAGDVGLYIFFVISGFLVAGSYERSGDVVSFFKARVLRIFPALLVFLLVCVFVVGPLVTTYTLAEYFAFPEIYRFIRLNGALIEYVPGLPGVFLGDKYPSPAGTLWSLFVEFRLYLYVALFGCFGMLKNRYVALCVVGLLVVGPWCRLGGCH